MTGHERDGIVFWTDAGTRGSMLADGDEIRRDVERIRGQIERGEVTAGPDGAREIARRIERRIPSLRP